VRCAELHLGWDSVKELDKQYMRVQLVKAGTPGPKVIGIDEVSIRTGPYLSDRGERPHSRRSDLVRRGGSLRGEYGAVLRMAGHEEK